jgi:16S rRNA (guanine527-N7)-methyltransferase
MDLTSAVRSLGLELDAVATGRLRALLDELDRWNRAYNLTSIDTLERRITHHLLDSLSILRWLRGTRIADIGTGAGFPGLPLAIVAPERSFMLVDSKNKKIRFVAHVVRTLDLQNVQAIHCRAQAAGPAGGFDTVMSRAYASLTDFVGSAGHLCAERGGRLLAMKGKRPDEELAALDALRTAQGGPAWATEVTRLSVPGIDEERHLVALAPTAAGPANARPGELS